MEKSTKISLSDYDFINWLISRLQYLHGYTNDSDIITKLISIQDYLVNRKVKYSDTDLDKVISRYFADFLLTKDESISIGYTETERSNLRNAIKHIIEDINQNDIPKEPILQ